MELAKSLVCPGATVTHGGSETLIQLGIPELLSGGDYNYLDRSAEGLTREQVEEIYRKSYFADYYFTSSNAVTETGELYNVDGNSNRVSAILYGPKNVLVFVGINKIVRDINEAITRVKTIAAPANTLRLSCDTPCAKTGECVSLKAVRRLFAAAVTASRESAATMLSQLSKDIKPNKGYYNQGAARLLNLCNRVTAEILRLRPQNRNQKFRL